MSGFPISFPSARLLGTQLFLVLAAAFLFAAPAAAASGSTLSPDAQKSVATAWKLLDYVAVDYGGAVKDGRAISAVEYGEMQEFTATIAKNIADLPPQPSKPALQAQAHALRQLVAAKASQKQVASASHALATAMLTAYPVPTAPTAVPNVHRGAALFAENCAACHGASGAGNGPAAKSLDTPPVDFTDTGRAQKRSLAALEQVIAQGISGTAMQPFDELPQKDRWDLAFYTGHFAFTADQVRRGAKLWASDPQLRARIPDLKALATMTPAALGEQIGQDKADAVMAYLRSNPDSVARAGDGATASLAVVRSKLAQALAAYRGGNRAAAKQLALSAYLDGFEPVEPLLGASNPTLLSTIETRMGELRAGIDGGEPYSTVASRAASIEELLADAEAALSPKASSGSTAFVGAFTILLREGLEALLVVVAMLAFLRKAEQARALRYVHGGWVAALVAGGATWLAATYFISISGASRELTEGLGSLLAAVVLISVGIWMHGKSHADQWRRYVREKLAKAMGRESGWFLFGLAFVVVYREVFETILFYAAMWAQGNGAAMLAGAATAVLALAAIAWAMLRYSRTLPLGTFFRYSSWLMAVLVFVLAGKGIAALQEAGWIDIAPLAAVPRISMLGLFPTIQSVAAQVIAVIAIVVGFTINNRRTAQGS